MQLNNSNFMTGEWERYAKDNSAKHASMYSQLYFRKK